MSYRAGVTPEDLKEAEDVGHEMALAAGWSECDTWEDANDRDTYAQGAADAILRAKGYDVFG